MQQCTAVVFVTFHLFMNMFFQWSSQDFIQFIYWTFKKFEQELAAKTLCFSFSHNDYGTIPTFVHY